MLGLRSDRFIYNPDRKGGKKKRREKKQILRDEDESATTKTNTSDNEPILRAGSGAITILACHARQTPKANSGGKNTHDYLIVPKEGKQQKGWLFPL